MVYFLYFLVTRYLLDPLAWGLYLLIGAMIADQLNRPRLRSTLLGISAIYMLSLVLLPFDQILARPLENRYPRPPLPAHVDGIVILDSGFHAGVFAGRGVLAQNGSEMRVVAGTALARRFPAAKLVYTGNSGASPHMKLREHQAGEALFADLGIPPDRVIWEQTSRDTGENLANSMLIVHPKKGETWMLVTSAIQMPRAMGIASKLGWKMTPWPSDYISSDGVGPAVRLGFPSDSMRNIDRALHEWVGYTVYRLKGRAD